MFVYLRCLLLCFTFLCFGSQSNIAHWFLSVSSAAISWSRSGRKERERERRWRWKGRTEQRRKNRTKITNIKWKGKGILEVKQRIRYSAYWYCKQLYLKSTNLLMSAMFCAIGSLCPNTYNNIVLVSSNFTSLISEEKHENMTVNHSFKIFSYSLIQLCLCLSHIDKCTLPKIVLTCFPVLKSRFLNQDIFENQNDRIY